MLDPTIDDANIIEMPKKEEAPKAEELPPIEKELTDKIDTANIIADIMELIKRGTFYGTQADVIVKSNKFLVGLHKTVLIEAAAHPQAARIDGLLNAVANLK